MLFLWLSFFYDDMAALILMKHMRAASRQQGIKEKLAIHIVCLIVKAHFLDAALTIKKSLETISCLKAWYVPSLLDIQ